MTSEFDRSQRRLGPIWLAPGITPLNTIALFFAGMMTLVFVTTLGILHPYLLHEHLKMPTELQGDFTGNLTVFVEIVAIAFMVPAGLLSDRIGRRRIYVMGFLLLSVSFVLIPFARTPAILILFRLIAAAGILRRTRRGAAPTAAGTYTFLVIAAAAAFSALVVWLGLKGGHPASQRDRIPMGQRLRTGINAIRENPRLKLTCVLVSGPALVGQEAPARQICSG